MNFKDPQVAAKYEAAFAFNQVTHVPGLFKGKLSDITIEAADALVAKQSNLLKLLPKPGSVPYHSGIDK